MAACGSNDVSFAREVIEAERHALEGLLPLLGDEFQQAVDRLFDCTEHGGRVVVTGIGKAGLIGRKISATLASTGTPSHWLHAVEAIHGDLGRIVPDDVVLALSNSGESEVADLLEPVKRIGAGVVAITGNPESALARHADIVLSIGPIREACPLGLAPTASTTAMLALGDALALAVAHRRNFDKEKYAEYHPGGELGRKLLKVEEVMRSLDECVHVGADTEVGEVLKRITDSPGRAGAVCIVDDSGVLIGIFTDGDLRRRILKGESFLRKPVSDVMTTHPKRIRIGSLAYEAAKILKDYKIDELPVEDADGRLRGIIDIQDLLAVRVIAP